MRRTTLGSPAQSFFSVEVPLGDLDVTIPITREGLSIIDMLLADSVAGMLSVRDVLVDDVSVFESTDSLPGDVFSNANFSRGKLAFPPCPLKVGSTVKVRLNSTYDQDQFVFWRATVLVFLDCSVSF